MANGLGHLLAGLFFAGGLTSGTVLSKGQRGESRVGKGDIERNGTYRKPPADGPAATLALYYSVRFILMAKAAAWVRFSNWSLERMALT